MKIYPPFPTCREATPTRRAEKLIYETLEASELDGLALYEVKPLSSAPQLDFAVWLLDVGTFGIQGKGGRYIIIDGEWYQVTDRGRIRKESPIPGTWDAAMAIHDVVQEHLRHKTFVIPGPGPDGHGAGRGDRGLGRGQERRGPLGIPRQPGGAPGGAGRGAEGLRQADVCRHRRGGGAGAARVNPGSPDY